MRISAFTPFKYKSFRFQWLADLATSWAFDMEGLILGWYILVETHSVLMLTIFASLQYVGTLLAPMFGVMGDRLGHRLILSVMRSLYAVLATTLMISAFMAWTTPYLVLIVAGLMGLVRPSDIGMRSALVGEIMPHEQLMGAMSIQRTTQDSARVAGALTGAGLVASLGMAWAYSCVVLFYLSSVILTILAGRNAIKIADRVNASSGESAWFDLRRGAIYTWQAPHLRATMLFAFLLNLTAFPLFTGLMPYVAKEVYGANQTVLGYMVGAGASGALLGSIIMSRFGDSFRSARAMLGFGAAWLFMILIFAHTHGPDTGIPILFVAGCMQTMGLIPINALLLRTSDQSYRGRIMGIRMLAIYGNLPGLILAGPLIVSLGYSRMAACYCFFGIMMTILIAWYWRHSLWFPNAIANRR